MRQAEERLVQKELGQHAEVTSFRVLRRRADQHADVDPRLHTAAGLSALAHLEHLIEKRRIQEQDGQYFFRK